MRTGKVSEAVLKRSVLRTLDDQYKKKSRYGADAAVLSDGDEPLRCYTTVSVLPGYQKHPEKQIISAANNLAAAGALPETFMVSALLPPDYEEEAFRNDMKRIVSAAKQFGAEVLGGHTQVSSQVLSPQYSIFAEGRSAGNRNQADMLLKPGQELVMTKWAAIGGTAALANLYQEELKKRFPHTLIENAGNLEQYMSICQEAKIVLDTEQGAMHDLSQGGVFGALWEMAERADVGLEIDLKKIPIRQETVELCEYFDINPYYFYSAGSLLIGTDHAELLVDVLAKTGIPSAVIGRVSAGKERIIRNGEDVRYMDRPQQEEWYRRFDG